jgi:hypothetical protein
MRPKPNPPFSPEDPHGPPILDPIYPLDPEFFLFYTLFGRNNLLFKSESGSRKRCGSPGQGEMGWKMEVKNGRSHE